MLHLGCLFCLLCTYWCNYFGIALDTGDAYWMPSLDIKGRLLNAQSGHYWWCILKPWHGTFNYFAFFWAEICRHSIPGKLAPLHTLNQKCLEQLTGFLYLTLKIIFLVSIYRFGLLTNNTETVCGLIDLSCKRNLTLWLVHTANINVAVNQMRDDGVGGLI